MPARKLNFEADKKEGLFNYRAVEIWMSGNNGPLSQHVIRSTDKLQMAVDCSGRETCFMNANECTIKSQSIT